MPAKIRALQTRADVNPAASSRYFIECIVQSAEERISRGLGDEVNCELHARKHVAGTTEHTSLSLANWKNTMAPSTI